MKKKAKLIQRTRFFSSDEYECSSCGYRSKRPFKVCPRCSKSMKKSGYDPFWVDEMEAFDEMFDDD